MQFLRDEDAAELLGVTVEGVRQQFLDGQLEGALRGGQLWLGLDLTDLHEAAKRERVSRRRAAREQLAAESERLAKLEGEERERQRVLGEEARKAAEAERAVAFERERSGQLETSGTLVEQRLREKVRADILRERSEEKRYQLEAKIRAELEAEL